ncbi:uncharacterized protein LOC125506441 [Triticum urartu]|uniref:uncharacterized protein LOC125506441 n=1 Tax=Triticum urartu TaxID=4572 RepID=UPI0020437AC6|nr:uncharacterized protein LOC125506441 [Triticum urartu]
MNENIVYIVRSSHHVPSLQFSHETNFSPMFRIYIYGRKVQLIQRHQLGEDSSNNHIMKWAIISDAIYISDDEGKHRHKRQRAKKTRGRAPCSEPCLCERTLTRGPIWCELWGKPSLTIHKRRFM